jgi:hypothetical protein
MNKQLFRLCEHDCNDPKFHNAHLTWRGRIYFWLPLRFRAPMGRWLRIW